MRFLLFFALFISPWGLSYVSAAVSDKSEGAGSVHHTPHPPHDHPSGHDHVKILKDSLRKSREDEKDDVIK